MTSLRGGAFWDWSLGRYPKAKEALLALQDRHGFNINLLLWCAWRAEIGENLSPARVKSAIAAVESWHGAITAPLRAARRRLSDFDAAGAQLKPRAQALEIEAERIEQEILQRLVSPLQATEDATPALDCAIRNLEAYTVLAGAGRNARYSAEVAALAALLMP